MLDAFFIKGFDWEAEVSDAQRDRLFGQIAAIVHKWRLELPFTIWLETTAPLAHIAGQGAIAFSPFLAPVFPGGIEEMQVFVKLLSNPDNVRFLLDRIEENELNAARK